MELLRRHDKYIYIESDKGLGPQQYLRPKNADGENDVSNLVSTFDSTTSTLDKSRCCAVSGRHRLIYFHLRSVSTFRLSSTVQRVDVRQILSTIDFSSINIDFRQTFEIKCRPVPTKLVDAEAA